ncbi:uncharacterized protein LOC118933399 [Manis pentadactyla]|uniref:uncharacterized protein LOC118933399 n=1 Tax=Manis pentadactyla TaxID=143292 RepID=UPI00255C42BD|nr:uncharacterized protein LOC118933399 [Manis pentadactyla]
MNNRGWAIFIDISLNNGLTFIKTDLDVSRRNCVTFRKGSPPALLGAIPPAVQQRALPDAVPEDTQDIYPDEGSSSPVFPSFNTLFWAVPLLVLPFILLLCWCIWRWYPKSSEASWLVFEDKICFCGQITSKDGTGCSQAGAFPCCVQTWGKVLSHSAYKHVRRQRPSPTPPPFVFNKTTSPTQTGSRYVPVLGCMVEVNPYPSWGYNPLSTTPCLRLVFTIQPYLTRHWLPYLTLNLTNYRWGCRLQFQMMQVS